MCTLRDSPEHSLHADADANLAAFQVHIAAFEMHIGGARHRFCDCARITVDPPKGGVCRGQGRRICGSGSALGSIKRSSGPNNRERQSKGCGRDAEQCGSAHDLTL